MSDLKQIVMTNANAWLNGNIDEESKAAIRQMIEQ